MTDQPIIDRRHMHREPLPADDSFPILWKRLDEQQVEIRELRESRVEDRARLTTLENSLATLNQRITENHMELKVSQQHSAETSERHLNRIYAEMRDLSQAIHAHDIRRQAAEEERIKTSEREAQRKREEHEETARRLKFWATAVATIGVAIGLIGLLKVGVGQ